MEEEQPEAAGDDIPLVSWYPGHIAKALREVREHLKLIDVVLELADGRLPAGSRVPDIDKLAGSKERLVVVTKGDLAEPAAVRGWQRAWERQGLESVLVNAQSGKGVPQLLAAIQRRSEALRQRLRARGRLARAPRVMVLGLPNVGKSSLINRLVRRSKVAVADKPGVTRVLHWVRITPEVEMLDTPGVMPPRLDDAPVRLQLVMIGCIPERAYDPLGMAQAAVPWLAREFPGYLKDKRGQPIATLPEFAAARGLRLGAAALDLERAARTFLHDFRAGKWGPITLDRLPGTGG